MALDIWYYICTSNHLSLPFILKTQLLDRSFVVYIVFLLGHTGLEIPG